MAKTLLLHMFYGILLRHGSRIVVADSLLHKFEGTHRWLPRGHFLRRKTVLSIRFLVDNVELILLVGHIASIEDLPAKASVSAREILHFSQRRLHLRFVNLGQSTQLVF